VEPSTHVTPTSFSLATRCRGETRPRSSLKCTMRSTTDGIAPGDPRRPPSGTAACTGGDRAARRARATLGRSWQNRRGSAARRTGACADHGQSPQTSGTAAAGTPRMLEHGHQEAGLPPREAGRPHVSRDPCLAFSVHPMKPGGVSPSSSIWYSNRPGTHRRPVTKYQSQSTRT